MWELIFLMVVMKIPILYLCWVVWWAIKAEPRPEEGAALRAVVPPDAPDAGPSWRFRRTPRPRPVRPHGGPVRAYRRAGYAPAPRARR